MPIHIHATPADLAPVVLLPGDPGRAQRLAALLEDARCYNQNRGLLGFSGSYCGRPVSVQTTGMGAPSAAIVAEELIQLGATTLIRVGTAGGAGRVRAGDLVAATASVPLDGATRAYLDGEPYAPAADFAIVSALVRAAEVAGVAHHTGLIATGDALYAESPDHAARWAARGVLAFEMEASVLFTIAALRGVRAGCIVVVTNAGGSRDWLEGEAYAVAEARLLRVALDATTALP